MSNVIDLWHHRAEIGMFRMAWEPVEPPDPLYVAISTMMPVSDVLWLDMMAVIRRLLNSELGKLFTGQYSEREFIEAVYNRLTRAHLAGVVSGRKRAGIDLNPADTADFNTALFVMQEQGGYLAGFLQRLEDKEPRYWDEEIEEWKKGVINRDLQMYATRVRGTANTVFEHESPDDAEFWWVLGVAEHCDDCIALASSSPHEKGTLPVFPGDGGTACLVNCKCNLRRGDGVFGFAPE